MPVIGPPPIKYAPQLTSEQYSTAFEVFLSTTNEHPLALKWVHDELLRHLHRAEIKVLSVGVGDGRFDIDVCETLVARQVKLRKYRMIEPDGNSVRRIHTLLRKNPRFKTASVYPGTLQQFNEVEKYDVIVFAHSLYYIPDRAAAIRKALSLLRSGGLILVLHQTETGISQIQKRFSEELTGHQRWTFNMSDLEKIVRPMPASMEVHRLPHELNLANIDRTGPQGDLFLSFTLEGDLSRIAPERKQRVWSYIDDLGLENDTPGRLPHPLGVGVIRPVLKP